MFNKMCFHTIWTKFSRASSYFIGSNFELAWLSWGSWIAVRAGGIRWSRCCTSRLVGAEVSSSALHAVVLNWNQLEWRKFVILALTENTFGWIEKKGMYLKLTWVAKPKAFTSASERVTRRRRGSSFILKCSKHQNQAPFIVLNSPTLCKLHRSWVFCTGYCRSIESNSKYLYRLILHSFTRSIEYSLYSHLYF